MLQVRANTNKSLFHEYHNSFGHKTEDCYDLRDAVEQLIREGRLATYIAIQQSPRKRRASPMKENERRNPRSQKISEDYRVNEDQEEETITRTINVIVGGFARSGITKSAYKKHLQEVLSLSAAKMKRAYKLSSTPKIVFSSSDLEGLVPGHDDPMGI